MARKRAHLLAVIVQWQVSVDLHKQLAEAAGKLAQTLRWRALLAPCRAWSDTARAQKRRIEAAHQAQRRRRSRAAAGHVLLP